ncbi:hypothetical protein N9M53_00840 [Alphaproteobacteria bacterium]|nr:hypothetical protein [Alphaproteobacteria bacterium]
MRKQKNSKLSALQMLILYTFFPLGKEKTQLGFLVQGPFQTTRSRETVGNNETWNDELIDKSGQLLLTVLHQFKKNTGLYLDILNCLPIQDHFFDDPSSYLFSPMAKALLSALQTEELLPCHNNTFTSGQNAKLATKAILDLFSPRSLSELFDTNGTHSGWLHRDLNRFNDGGLSRYLRNRLSVERIDHNDIIPKLTGPLLEKQIDPWMQRLYAFSDEQDQLFTDDIKKTIPIIRLKTGAQSTICDQERKVHVYLPHPDADPEKFHIISPSIYKGEEVESFFTKMKIEKISETDVVIKDVLTKYDSAEIDISDTDYSKDIKRILKVWEEEKGKSDQTKFKNLKEALSKASFVKVIDAGTDTESYQKPADVYIPTERLYILLKGLDGVYIVNNELNCLKGEIRSLLTACKARDQLTPDEKDEAHLEDDEFKAELEKRDLGDHHIRINTSRTQHENYFIPLLDKIISSIANELGEEQENKAKALWEELIQIRKSRESSLKATTYLNGGGNIYIKYGSAFIYQLNNEKWIPLPDHDGVRKPESVLFDDLGWEKDPFLQDKIIFKTPEREKALAELGMSEDTAALAQDIEKIKQKVENGTATTSEKIWLKNVTNPPSKNADTPPANEVQETETELEAELETEPAKISPQIPEIIPVTHHPAQQTHHPRIQQPISERLKKHQERQANISSPSASPSVSPSSTQSSPRISSDQSYGQGGHSANRDIENAAVDFVLKQYPQFKDANKTGMPNNPGFDLCEEDENRKRIRWIEVKGTSKKHGGIPQLSSTQYGFALGLNALGEGHRYWHITVEEADTNPNIICVEDVADKRHHIVPDPAEEE